MEMNIIFDVDDTLYDQTQPFKKAFDSLWKNRYDVDVDALYKVSRQYSNAVFDLVMDNKMSVDESGVYRMKKAMHDFGYAISEEEALAFQLCYRHNQAHIEVSETMQKLLTFCVDEKVTLGVLTNGISDHQHKKMKGLQLTRWIKPENLFVSDDIRLSKPDPNAFLHIAKAMQIKADNTIYVGDSFEHDVVGARAAGWQVIHFNRRCHDVTSYDIQADYEVFDEEQLVKCIQTIVLQNKE